MDSKLKAGLFRDQPVASGVAWPGNQRGCELINFSFSGISVGEHGDEHSGSSGSRSERMQRESPCGARSLPRLAVVPGSDPLTHLGQGDYPGR